MILFSLLNVATIHYRYRIITIMIHEHNKKADRQIVVGIYLMEISVRKRSGSQVSRIAKECCHLVEAAHGVLAKF